MVRMMTVFMDLFVSVIRVSKVTVVRHTTVADDLILLSSEIRIISFLPRLLSHLKKGKNLR